VEIIKKIDRQGGKFIKFYYCHVGFNFGIHFWEGEGFALNLQIKFVKEKE